MQLDANDPWSFVRGFQPVSLCDWPGKVSLVLFFGSCNLRCPTCHNWDLATNPEALPLIPRETILAFLRSRRNWLDGVVISGGEPAGIPGLKDVCATISETGLPLKVDSNGLRPGVLHDLLDRDLVQKVAVDLKGPFAKYPELTGERCTSLQAESAFASLFETAGQFGSRVSFRCTRVPGLTGADIEAATSCLPKTHDLVLQDYVPGRIEISPASGRPDA
ncbi:MAG: anaerobic ribonucleoside-triphosphate reductase activating protein [Desulfohalobiaceae bacterium]|nr:anaerobic ribonucleoside-triphosphate reductase activating protein [Desulfohalobiaceae bacterium]